jgi:hypothetical protein
LEKSFTDNFKSGGGRNSRSATAVTTMERGRRRKKERKKEREKEERGVG